MSDIRLFRTDQERVTELQGTAMAVEKSLQTLLERHLEAFLGIRFLATEYSTGKTHGGRIDTLGLDENGAPVIIEYKRALNENVINQGLYYLDWLLDHQAEFVLLVMRCLGREQSEQIAWDAARLLCIAGEFTKYDEHAVAQIKRNIELIRYRRYGRDLLLLELVNAVSAPYQATSAPSGGTSPPSGESQVADYLAKADAPLRDLYEALKAFLLALGDDVQVKTLKYYFAFKRLRNFACVEVHPVARRLNVYVKVDPDTVLLQPGFTRDVREIGHFGIGDLEITLSSMEDLERAQPLLVKSYEAC